MTIINTFNTGTGSKEDFELVEVKPLSEGRTERQAEFLASRGIQDIVILRRPRGKVLYSAYRHSDGSIKSAHRIAR